MVSLCKGGSFFPEGLGCCVANKMAARSSSSLQIQIPPAETATGDRAEGSGDDDDEFSYCDIMMLGRTGLGKSTVGNKLLGIDPETREPYKEETEIKQWGYDGDEQYFFETGDGKESVTKKCKVLSSGIVRVMDTRGFADSEMTEKYGVVQGNLQSFRWILQAQRAHDLRFSRVLYFFPKRGPPERADGTLQEEIKVMYGYFGQKIFDIMVVVVTNHKREHFQLAGFSEEDIAETQEVFKTAFKKVVGGEKKEGEVDSVAEFKCPPVVYIPFKENYVEVFKLINGVQVVSSEEYFTFSPEYPKDPEFRSLSSQVSLAYDTSRENLRRAFLQNLGTRFSFEDRCTRCAIKLRYEKQESGEELPIGIIHPNGDEDVYDNSYCHPLFVPKYTKVQKFFGGVAHIITLGMGKLYEYATKNKSWPSFTSSDEVCINCGEPPGSQSCHPVNQHFEIAGKMEKIDHERELDTVKLLQET